MELLVNGKNAFPKIMECIEQAQHTILINMFIWRNDTIGNIIAQKVLEAANRGVQVTISKDRYGLLCEMCEENMKSFFHKNPSLSERLSSWLLYVGYNHQKHIRKPGTIEDDGSLLKTIMTHPNIHIECDTKKYDHSKFYLFDDTKLIVGGVNIEDKENGSDLAGRVYNDHMVYIDDPELVQEFIEARKNPSNTNHFPMNLKQANGYFGMEESYLRLIDSCEGELTIVMAYFSVMPAFEQAILNAYHRGVDVRIIIPLHANFQDDLNKKTVSRLREKSQGGIQICMYEGMLHTKLLMSEKQISFGSCNITKKAFRQLDELNFVWPNGNNAFANSVNQSVESLFQEAQKLPKKVSYHRIMAFGEGLML